MAEDDYVLLTEAAYSVSGNVVAVKADTISGKVDGTRTDGSILVDGTWYKKAGASVTAPTAGDDLEYHDLAELAGVLAQQARARFARDAGALGGADAGEGGRETGAQKAESHSAELFKKTHFNFLLLFVS